jgi:hypothetical protein
VTPSASTLPFEIIEYFVTNDQPNQRIRVTITSENGVQYTLQSSTNLASWSDAETKDGTGDALIFETDIAEPDRLLCANRRRLGSLFD